MRPLTLILIFGARLFFCRTQPLILPRCQPILLALWLHREQRSRWQSKYCQTRLS